jgi:hypothetical protein
MKALLYIKFGGAIEIGDCVTYIPDPYSDPCDWIQGKIVTIGAGHPNYISVAEESGKIFVCNMSKCVKGWVTNEEDLTID